MGCDSALSATRPDSGSEKLPAERVRVVWVVEIKLIRLDAKMRGCTTLL
jgi:hypothetical protein